jgi:ATP-binding cassette subfamily B protein
VAIARALLRDPAILLLDEATSALDPRTEHEITATLDRAAAGRTTVAITHRLASVSDYDRIFVVVDGRLAEQGTHEELLAARGPYAELWAEQHGRAAPAAQPLDVKAALARLPLFAELSPGELGMAEAKLRPLELRSGDRLAEGGGRLAIVARGVGYAMVPAAGGGELVRLAELRPGQAFGLSALLGDESDAVLEADGPLSLLVLGADALRDLAVRFPAVAGALAGRTLAVAAPESGVRLDPPSAVMDRSALDSLLRHGPPEGAASGVRALPSLPQGSTIAAQLREVRR